MKKTLSILDLVLIMTNPICRIAKVKADDTNDLPFDSYFIDEIKVRNIDFEARPGYLVINDGAYEVPVDAKGHNIDSFYADRSTIEEKVLRLNKTELERVNAYYNNVVKTKAMFEKLVSSCENIADKAKVKDVDFEDKEEQEVA